MGQLGCCRGCWFLGGMGDRRTAAMGQIALLFCVAERNGEEDIREADRSRRATLTGGEDDRQRATGKVRFVLCAEVCYNRNEKPYGRAA